MDAVTAVSKENGYETIIRINQALPKPDEYVSLLSTFQVRYNGTGINASSMQFDPRSQFGIVLPNEDVSDTVVNFTLRGIVMGVPIRIPSNEELDTLPVYEIKSSLFWDPSRKLHAEMKWLHKRFPISVGSSD